MNSAGDRFLPAEWIEHKTAVDELEPQEYGEPSSLRAFALRSAEVLNGFGNVIERVLARPNATLQDVAVAFWQAAYGAGLNCCDGMSMTDRAASLDVERATISKGACQFCDAHGLERSYHMKRGESASQNFTRARVESIKRNGALPHVLPAGRSV